MEELIKYDDPALKDLKVQDLKDFNSICLLIAKGYSVKEACDEMLFDVFYFYSLKANYSLLTDLWSRAETIRGAALAEESLKAFDDVPEVIILNEKEVQNQVGIARAREIAKNKQWFASKLNRQFSDTPPVAVNIAADQATFNIDMGGTPLNMED